MNVPFEPILVNLRLQEDDIVLFEGQLGRIFGLEVVKGLARRLDGGGAVVSRAGKGCGSRRLAPSIIKGRTWLRAAAGKAVKVEKKIVFIRCNKSNRKKYFKVQVTNQPLSQINQKGRASNFFANSMHFLGHKLHSYAFIFIENLLGDPLLI